MVEKDPIAKALTDLGLTNNVERELRLDHRELVKALQPIQGIGILARESALSLEKFSFDLAVSPFLKELSVASSAISAFRDMPEFHAIQANSACISEVAAGIGKDIALTLAPIRSVVAEMQLGFATQLDANRQILEELKLGHESWFRSFEPVSLEFAKVANVSFAIPESALLQWPSDVLNHRAALVKDCVFNTAALQDFYAAATSPDTTVSADQLMAASQFVLDHADVVSHLPPSLDMREDELAAVNKKHRNEEIGAKLELALADFDARLLELRRQAWRNLAGGDVSGARLGMAGIRELFTDVLHALAPDSAVKMTAQWGARSNGITRPTRRMRLDYVLGDDAASDADALLQFSDSVNRAQRFVHAFADDVELVRIQMAHMESWIYLLLIRSRGRRRSN
jgi:hypothetical protein